MIILDLLNDLDKWAPFAYQESYDNSGLLVGDRQSEINGILIHIDLTPAVIDEAIELGANTIITHHPIIFKGLKNLIANNDIVSECVRKAIKSDINIIALHTNLDNVKHGVNHKIAEKIGLHDTEILAPKNETIRKLTFYAPPADSTNILAALYEAGAGHIGHYAECSFRHTGLGTYTPLEGSTPYIGQKGQAELTKEERIELIYHLPDESSVLAALLASHPYETVAYDIGSIINTDPNIGAGMLGNLPSPIPAKEFMDHLKNVFKTPCLRYTKIVHEQVQKIAFCGGSGSFLLPLAKSKKADVFLTADFKYHDFFESDDRLNVIDIGHFEIEQYTSELIFGYLSEKNYNFAIHFSEINTNPINYY